MPESQKTPLQVARERAGYRNAAEFARRHDLVESTYRSHENGTRPLTMAAAKEYAPYLKVPWASLLEPVAGEQTVMPFTSNTHFPAKNNVNKLQDRVLNVTELSRDVPVLGTAACGDGEADLFELNGQTVDFVRRPPRLIGVRDAFAVVVAGLSMSPWSEPGDVCYVAPHDPPRINDYVLVQLKPKKSGDAPRAYIKKLIKRTSKEIRLLQFEPREEFSIKLVDIVSIQRVIPWRELMGF